MVYRVLHTGGFMHGDLHSSNIVVQPTTWCVYLIDFDQWADKGGVVEHPTTGLNPNIGNKLPRD